MNYNMLKCTNTSLQPFQSKYLNSSTCILDLSKAVIFIHLFAFSADLHSLLYLPVFIWNHLFSAQLTSFRIYFNVGLLVTHFLTFCVFGNIFISNSFLKDIFVKYRVLVLQFLSFYIFIVFCLLSFLIRRWLM